MQSLILFDHPLEEDMSTTEDWRRCKEDHCRRFIRSRGNYFDGKKRIEDSEIFFWAEWEAKASIAALSTSIKPKYVCTPSNSVIEGREWANNYTSSPDSRRHNTDPFVFGDNFYYANCKQGIKKNKLRTIPEGSIIIFGNNYNKTTRKYDFDTLMVVGEGINYTPEKLVHEYINQQRNHQINFNGHFITKEFIEISTLPLFYYSKSLRNREYTLYPCKTYSPQNQSFFSFFPCSNTQVFNIPRIKLSSRCKFGAQKKGIRSVNLKNTQLQDEWNSIIQQVKKHGLMLGVYANPPQ